MVCALGRDAVFTALAGLNREPEKRPQRGFQSMGSLRNLKKGEKRDNSEPPPPPPEPSKVYPIGSREAFRIETRVYGVLCKRIKEMLTTEKIMESFRLQQLLVDDSEEFLAYLITEHCMFPWALTEDDLSEFLMRMVDDGHIHGYEFAGRQSYGLSHMPAGKFGENEAGIYHVLPRDGASISRAEIAKQFIDYQILASNDELDAAIQNLIDLALIRREVDGFVFAH